MRTPLLCLGLICISSFTGCIQLSGCDDGYCLNNCSRIVTRKREAVSQMPAPPKEAVTISESLPPFAVPPDPVVICEPARQRSAPDRALPIPRSSLANIKQPEPLRVDAVPPLPVANIKQREQPAPSDVDTIPPLPVANIKLPQQPAPSDVDTIPPLPVANIKLPERPAPFQAEAIPPGQTGTMTIDPDEVVPIQIEKSKKTPSDNTDPVMPTPPDNGYQDARPEKFAPPKNEHVQPGNSEDFKTITGQVEMWRKSVRVRYAPVDQDDEYGGFVVLQGNADVAKLREGKHVRVRGVLIPPENRNRSARFMVQAIEMLD